MSWIELKIELPTVCEPVLICTDRGNVSTGHLSKRYENLWTIDNQELSNDKVIAWQALPKPLIFSQGISCDTAKRTCSYRDDFSEDEQKIGDTAFAECQNRIKQVVEEYLTKDDIMQEVWGAMRDGVSSFCEEHFEDFIREVVDELKSEINLNFNMNINRKNKEIKKE